MTSTNEPFYQSTSSVNPITIADMATTVMSLSQPIQYRLYLDGHYRATISGSQLLNPNSYDNYNNTTKTNYFKITETPIQEIQLNQKSGKLEIKKPGNYMICLNVNRFIKDVSADTIITLSLLAEKKDTNAGVILASEKTLNANTNSYNFFSLSCIIDESISIINPQLYINDKLGTTMAFNPLIDPSINDTFISVFIYSL